MPSRSIRLPTTSTTSSRSWRPTIGTGWPDDELRAQDRGPRRARRGRPEHDADDRDRGDDRSSVVTKEYGALTGSSVAAPHVSGAAALLLSKYPALSYHQVKQILMQTSDKVVPGLCQSHGRVNIAKALAAVPAGAMGRVLNTRDDPTKPASFYTSIQAAIDAAEDGDTLIAEGKTGGQYALPRADRLQRQGDHAAQRQRDESLRSEHLSRRRRSFSGSPSEGSVVTFANGEGKNSRSEGLHDRLGRRGKRRRHPHRGRFADDQLLHHQQQPGPPLRRRHRLSRRLARDHQLRHQRQRGVRRSMGLRRRHELRGLRADDHRLHHPQ